MNIFRSTIRTLYLLRERLRPDNSAHVRQDVIAYTDKLKEAEQPVVPLRKSTGKTILLFSDFYLTFTMRIDSILARTLRDEFGFTPVIVTRYKASFLSDQVHKKVYGLDNRIYLEDFVTLILNSDAKKCIRRCLEAHSFDEIKAITYKNTKVGLHALATAVNLTMTGDALLDDSMAKRIAKYISRSCRVVDAVERIIERYRPTTVMSVEKALTGTCEVFYEAIHRGIDYVQWCGSLEPNKLTLKRYTLSNYRMHPNSVSERAFADTPYEPSFADTVDNILKTNYATGNIYIYKSHKLDIKPILSKDEMLRLLNLDGSKKTAILFSHVLNDANLFYGDDLFEGGFKEWLVKTIEAAATNDRVNWILKLHPGNALKRQYTGYSGEYAEIFAIKEHLGEVPRNVTVIKPESSDINPYSFFKLADYGITVRGTIGIELPTMGIPVITGGTGRYSGMGFTNDSRDKDEYLDKIRRIDDIPPLTAEERQAAIKYAYMLFNLRPADCNSFMKEYYPYQLPHPMYRDFNIVDPDYWNNRVIKNIAAFIAISREEDYLSDQDYWKAGCISQ